MATINTNLAGVTSGSQYASAGNNTIYTNLPFNTAGTTTTNVTFIVGASASIDILYNQSFKVDSTTGFHELFGNIEVQGVSSDYTVSSWYGKVVLTHKTSGQVISFQLTKPQNAASNSGVNVEFLDGAVAFTSNVNGQGVWTVWATTGGTDTSTWGQGGYAAQVPGTYSAGATPLDLSEAAEIGFLNYSVNSSDITNWTGVEPTYTLTTNIDSINVTGTDANTVLSGLQQGTGSTWNTGDTINGNGLTTVNLIGNGGGVSVVDANNIANININLVASTTVNAIEFDNVDAITISKGIAGGVLTVSNGLLTTDYTISNGRATDLTVTSWQGATKTTDAATLVLAGAGTGTSGAATADVDFSSGNVLDIVNIVTSGTNYLDFLGGTQLDTMTVTGNGTNYIEANSYATTAKFDLSAATGANTLDVGNITATQTILGGTGTSDVLVAGIATATQIIPTKVSGFESLDLDFAAAGILNATNITGVTSVDISGNAASGTISNLANTATTVSTIASNTGTLAVNYVNKAAAVVDYNVGGDAAVANSTGTTFSNVADLTINAVGKSTSNIGALATGTAATALTLTTAAAANDLTVASVTALNLQSIGVTATAGDVSVSGSATMSSLESLIISASGGADVNFFGGGITAHAANVSSFESISITAGDDSAITVGNINGGTGASAASISAYDVTIGANFATSAVGLVTAESIGAVNVTAGANTTGATLTIGTLTADSIGDITVAVGTNNTVAMSTNDSGGGAYAVGNVTASGAGGYNLTAQAGGGTDTIGFIDLSGLSGASTINVSGLDSAGLITGGKGADTITGSLGDDVITGGLGADIIAGYVGNDTITLTETTASADVYNFTGTAITSAGGNVDTITGFGVANDDIGFGSTFLNGETYMTSGNTSVGAGSGFTSANWDDIYIASTGSAANASGVYSLISGADTSTASETAIFVINDASGNANIYYVNENLSGGAGLDTTDIQLIGVLSGTSAAGLTAANIGAVV